MFLRGRNIYERNINWLPPVCPSLGIQHQIPACALIGIQTSELLVHGKMLNQMSHTSQREISHILQRGKLRPGKRSNSLTKLSNVLLIAGLGWTWPCQKKRSSIYLMFVSVLFITLPIQGSNFLDLPTSFFPSPPNIACFALHLISIPHLYDSRKQTLGKNVTFAFWSLF